MSATTALSAPTESRAQRCCSMIAGCEPESGLWTVFERDAVLFRRKDGVDISTQLIVAGSDETWPVVVTQLEGGQAAWQPAGSDALHTRPRLPAPSNNRQV